VDFFSILLKEVSMPELRVGDADIHYEVKGEGTPFVFIAETACDGDVWNMFQVPEFSKDHRTIVTDYRGTGQSTRTPTRYTTRMFCDDIASVMGHIGAEQAVVCGHSMGGRVAQLLALEHPKKVKKLILASSGAAHPGAHGIPLRIATEMVEMSYEKYVRDHTIEVGWTEQYVKAHLDKIEDYLKVRMANLASVECYFRHVIARQEHDTSGRLADIKVPTLVLVGEDDHGVVSDMSHRKGADILANGIPNARLVLFPGERHSYFYSNPEPSHKVIREFLAS
jgi:3-oxoadipate enol-lactonase